MMQRLLNAIPTSVDRLLVHASVSIHLGMRLASSPQSPAPISSWVGRGGDHMDHLYEEGVAI